MHLGTFFVGKKMPGNVEKKSSEQIIFGEKSVSVYIFPEKYVYPNI